MQLRRRTTLFCCPSHTRHAYVRPRVSSLQSSNGNLKARTGSVRQLWPSNNSHLTHTQLAHAANAAASTHVTVPLACTRASCR